MNCGNVEPATAGNVEASGRLSRPSAIRKDGTLAACTVHKVNLLTDLCRRIGNYALQRQSTAIRVLFCGNEISSW